MISAQELRIGNWVLRSVTGENHKPYEITKGYDIDNVEHMIPINLTPDLLEKCGFVKDGFGAYNIDIQHKEFEGMGGIKILSFAGDYLYLREGKADARHEDDIVVLWNKDIQKVMYLHQLMNLYFALTNQELKVEL